MSTYLIVVPLPEEHEPLAERIIRSAVCFLEARGDVARTDIGSFRRAGRAGAEMLRLVTLGSEADGADEAATARALEGVLRATLTAAGLRGGDVRVFLGEC